MLLVYLFGGGLLTAGISRIIGPLVLALAAGIVLSYVLMPIAWVAEKVHMTNFVHYIWIHVSGTDGENILSNCQPADGPKAGFEHLDVLVVSEIALIFIMIGLVLAIICVFGAYLAPIVGAVTAISAFFMQKDTNDPGPFGRYTSLGPVTAGLLGGALLLLPLFAVSLLLRGDAALSTVGC